MNSGLFLNIKSKYDSLKNSEKRLFLAALVIVLLLLMDRLVFSPITRYQQELKLKIAEKSQLLSDVKKYLSRKDWQKDLFKGKASDFLVLLMQKAKESGFEPIRIIKTENSVKGILIEFEGDSSIQNILNFIRMVESFDFMVLYRNAEISYMSGSRYHFKGNIMVIKG